MFLNHVKIQVTNYKEDILEHEKYKISFDFKVRGGNDYHDMTVLLYENVFNVKIPAREIEFRGKINKYSTSRVDFTDEHSISEFKLELIEVDGQ